MTYELRVPETVTVEPKSTDAMTGLRERADNAKKLGLTAQASFLERELHHAEKKPRELNPLTADEAIVWKAWLPTTYRDDKHVDGTDRAMRNMSSYMFDKVPSPVLKRWARLKEQNLFDYFEIWTPEVQKTDPILIGVLGNERYLLAQWGESDANFLNFDDIVKNLWSRRWDWSDRLSMELAWIGVYLSCFGIIAAALTTVFVACGLAGFIIDPGYIVGAVACTAVGSIFASRYFMKKTTRGEKSFIKALFAISPERPWAFEATEHLRAICRIKGTAPRTM